MDPINTENNNDDDWNGNDNVSNKFSTYEQECIDYIESTTPANIIINETDDECDDDTDDEERLNYERKLWNYFQSSAMAIAQLYSRGMWLYDISIRINLIDSFILFRQFIHSP